VAVVLIRMKLRVLRHSLHGRRALIFALGVCYALAAAVVTALVPLAAGADIEAGTDIVAALFAVWAVGWLVGPILSGGGDETLRPENFALLPLSAWTLARGLLAASLVGVAPIATLIAFLGALTVGARSGAIPALVAAVGILLELAFVVVLSRVAIATLGAVHTSRRGQDAGVLLASLAGLTFLPLRFVVEAVGPILVDRQSPTLSAVVRGLPSGWASVAVHGAATGSLVWAVGPLLGLAALVFVLVLAWAPLLRRRLTVGAVSTGPSKRSRRSPSTPYERSLGPVGAVVLRELRLWWRDARRRSLLVVSLVTGVAIPAFSFASVGSSAASYASLWFPPDVRRHSVRQPLRPRWRVGVAHLGDARRDRG